MDFSNIIIQFLVVCIGSFIGPLLLQYFKTKRALKDNQKKMALKAIDILQSYSFILYTNIKNHGLAMASSEKGDDGHLYSEIGSFQFSDSIPSICILDDIYVLDNYIVNSLQVFIRKSECYKFNLAIEFEIDSDIFIESYIEKISLLFWESQKLVELISNNYRIPIEKGHWLDDVPKVNI